MARLVWVGVGAVGGIYAYRKGEQAMSTVREQGLVGTLQVVTATTVNAVVALRSQPEPPGVIVTAEPAAGVRMGRFRITRESTAAPAHRSAIMDTGVIDITDSTRRPMAEGRRARAARERKAN